MKTKHGHCSGGHSPTYKSWEAMWRRCTDSRHPAYHRYGGRGITVCDRWKSFENFLADMGERPEATWINRKENDKGYEPGNCEWVTFAESGRNRSTNVNLTHDGKTKCLSEWAKLLGIGRATLRARIVSGWDARKALTQPVRGKA